MTPPRMYVLDDDPDFSQLVTTVADELGFDTTAFRNGASFRAAFGKEQPAAMVVDGLLPDCNGVDLLEGLAKDAPLPPTLFLSAFFHKYEVTSRLTRVGVRTARRKPIQLLDLHKAMSELLPAPPAPKVGASDLRNEFRRRRATYIDELPTFAKAVHDLRWKLTRDHTAHQSAAALIHRIVGMAGAYDLTVIAELASRIEGHIAAGATAARLDGDLFELAIAMEAEHAKHAG